MKTRYQILIFVALITSLLLTSCSDLRDNLPTATPVTLSIHVQGWADTASSNFHGKSLQESGWNLNECRQCHGPNYSGGTASISCEQSGCHIDGNGNPKSPESCNTCHGNFLAAANDTASWAPPKSLSKDTSTSMLSVGAHQRHLASSIMTTGKNVECQECHIVPAAVSAAGHLGSSPAQVIFNGPLASLKTNSDSVVPNPSFNLSTGKCSNTYCHGYFINGNPTNAPVWNIVDGSQKKCGSCHGNPVTGNPKPISGPHQFYADGNTCQDCHFVGIQPTAVYVGGQWSITDKVHHINGKLSWFGTEVGF